MATVTITKYKYEILKKRASLYDGIMRSLSKKRWGIEKYSSGRIQEFMAQDKLDRQTISKLTKLLKSSRAQEMPTIFIDKHFLSNQKLLSLRIPFRIVTPGDFIQNNFS